METKITHYEDEIINEDCIKLNDCKNYAELMTKYMLDGYYKVKVNKPPYGDPDSIRQYCSYSCSYYKDLTTFLKQKEKSDRFKYSYSDRRGEIAVSCDGKQGLKLKSDQFGFSVNDFEKYPYGWLCKKIKDNKEIEEKKKKEIFELIANCIYDTRTLGGGFLWPLDMYKYYNKARGGTADSLDTPHEAQFYIEDRVDLTLLEINHLFKWICGNDEQEKERIWKTYTKDEEIRPDIIFNNEKLKDDKAENIIKGIEWLRHFGSFEGYIKFFCFEDFMEEGNPGGMPLDIVKSVLSPSEDGKSAKIPLKYPTEYKKRGKHSIYRLSEFEMMNMLKNVRILTLKRSRKMQDFVNQY